MKIERVIGVRSEVGEGPVWDAGEQALWFIDILGCRVSRLDADGGIDSWATPERVGAVAPLDDGRVAVALGSGVSVLDPKTGVFGPVEPVDSARGVICEGKVDRQGRLVVMTSDPYFTDEVGEILRWEPGRGLSRLDGGFVLGNGPCWSVDGETLYAADSIRRTVYTYPYSVEAGGTVGPRRELISFREDPFPDGAVVDAEDHLLVVMHRSSSILRIDPVGTVVDRIEMPTPNITSLAFGGPDLDVLFVTSLDPTRVPVPADAAALSAERGLLYKVTGTGFRGVADAVVRTEGPDAGAHEQQLSPGIVTVG